MTPLVPALALALLLAACSLIVGGETEPLRCSQEGHVGAPACDAGWICRAGVCEPHALAGGAASGQGGYASPHMGDAGAGGAR